MEKYFIRSVVMAIILSIILNREKVGGSQQNLQKFKQNSNQEHSTLISNFPISRQSGATSNSQNFEEPAAPTWKLNLTSFPLMENLIDLLKIETLIIFKEDGPWTRPTFKNLQQFFSNPRPKVIISQDVHWKLKDHFNSNILSIVLLPEFNNEKILELFLRSLDRWHLKYVLFVTGSSIKPFTKWLDLFKWCRENGFWNSLIIDLKGNSLTMDYLSQNMINNISVPDFLRPHSQWPDLKRYKIRCSVGDNPPWVMAIYDQNHVLQIGGYYGWTINLFVQKYNAKLELYKMSNAQYYSELDCVEHIAQDLVDICGDSISMDPYNIVTPPDEITPSFLLVASDKPLPKFFYFLKPFQLSAWTIVTVSFFYKIITLSIIHRLQRNSWNASLHMLYALVSVLYLPFQLTHMDGWYRRYVEFLLIIVGFVVANWYLSVLSSILSTRLYSRDLNSLEDLALHNISIMVNEFEMFLLNASDNHPIISQQLLLVSNDVLLEHRRVLDPNYAYYSQTDKNDFYLHQQKFMLRPRMKELSHIPINMIMAGIPMRANWPLEELFKVYLARLLDNGLYMQFLEVTKDDCIRSGFLQYLPTDYQSVEPLTVDYFQMPAVLMAVGYSLAFVAFLWEKISFREFQKKKRIL